MGEVPGRPCSPLSSSVIGQKALGEPQKAVPPWLTLGAGYLGAFPIDEIICILVKCEREGLKWGGGRCQECRGAGYFSKDNNLSSGSRLSTGGHLPSLETSVVVRT